jgi:N-acetylglucosamine-6-phosphate deacetylase
MVTLAPELPGAPEMIDFLRKRLVVPSMGHSNATYDQIRELVSRGLSHCSHAFNAMRGLHHREPGAAGAVLDLPEITAEVICDGVHVHPAIVRLLARTKGAAGLILVTDAMRAAGIGDGRFALGSLDVTVLGGVARLENGALAGSTLTMDAALRNFMAFTGLSLAEAVPLVSENPARAVGYGDRIGSIDVGKEADLVLLNSDIDVLMTVVGGKTVWTR